MQLGGLNLFGGDRHTLALLGYCGLEQGTAENHKEGVKRRRLAVAQEHANA